MSAFDRSGHRAHRFHSPNSNSCATNALTTLSIWWSYSEAPVRVLTVASTSGPSPCRQDVSIKCQLAAASVATDVGENPVFLLANKHNLQRSAWSLRPEAEVQGAPKRSRKLHKRPFRSGGIVLRWPFSPRIVGS
jgi:hypothetical protein